MHDPRATLTRLLEIMATLRSSEGCPWDREQTPQTLMPYLIEETFEVLEAIELEDPAAICEELGDLLLQIVFQAQIFAEQGAFDFGDVAAGIGDKLVRRHPHVFGDSPHGGSEAHQRRWEEIKQAEKRAAGREGGALGGIPRALPPLQRAGKVIAKAGRAGLVWPDPEELMRQSATSLAQFQAALAQDELERKEEHLGNLLFDLAVLSQVAGLDPQACLKGAVSRFEAAFSRYEPHRQPVAATTVMRRWRPGASG